MSKSHAPFKLYQDQNLGFCLEYQNKIYRFVKPLGDGKNKYGQIYLYQDAKDESQFLVCKGIKDDERYSQDDAKGEVEKCIKILGMGELLVTEGNFFILMPYFRGETFYFYYKEVWKYASELLQGWLAIIGALIEFHEVHQLVHRDCNSRNFILQYKEKESQYKATLIDFHFSRPINYQSNPLPRGEQVLVRGPEVTQQSYKVVPREDIFNLGVVLKHSLSICKPFFKNFPNIQNQIKYHLTRMVNDNPKKRPALRKTQFYLNQYRAYCEQGIDQPSTYFQCEYRLMTISYRIELQHILKATPGKKLSKVLQALPENFYQTETLFGNVDSERKVDIKTDIKTDTKTDTKAENKTKSDASLSLEKITNDLILAFAQKVQDEMKLTDEKGKKPLFPLFCLQKKPSEDFFNPVNYINSLKQALLLSNQQIIEALILLCRFFAKTNEIMHPLNINVLIGISILIVSHKQPTKFFSQAARLNQNFLENQCNAFSKKLNYMLFVNHETVTAFLKAPFDAKTTALLKHEPEQFRPSLCSIQ